jgi:hypothetical protein
MTTCAERHHPDHVHQHGPNCGHAAIRHDGHVDYLHDGHLHHMHGDHVDEHIIAISATNPVHCTPEIRCSGHEHGPNCGHEAIPHGDHFDYLVNGRLHSFCSSFSSRIPTRHSCLRFRSLSHFTFSCLVTGPVM